MARETARSGAGDAADPTGANLLASALIICFELSRNERDIDKAIALLRPLTDRGPENIGRPPRPPS
ncbi:hypothetical protein AB0878_48305 [Amycolatopsis sp. NPDC047767]|uniref:hypothetical protein n=1 Tax=Amycolatopsis sp. NPDC047767 TaxID=3156765 RepID=UPI0034563E1F